MILKQNRGIPDPRNRFCTAELKVKTFKRYLKSIGWKKWVNTIGIRADEPNRIKESNERFYDNWYPIAEANHTKHDILDFWKRQTFDLKVTSGFGNCDGCFLKSEKSIATLWKLHPERAEWWMSFEEMKHGKKGNKRTFYKNRTYKEIGDFVSRQGDWIFDTEGVLCQADDGECTG